MKKSIKINVSADLSVDTATEILSEAVENLTGKKVSEITCKYGKDGKFEGYHIVFSGVNAADVDQVIDRSFRPMRYG